MTGKLLLSKLRTLLPMHRLDLDLIYPMLHGGDFGGEKLRNFGWRLHHLHHLHHGPWFDAAILQGNIAIGINRDRSASVPKACPLNLPFQEHFRNGST